MRQARNAQTAVSRTTVAEIGQRIRELRLARKLTLQSVGDVTGLSKSMVSLVERGRASPSIGTLIAISDALSVHMADLFAHPEPPTGPFIPRDEQQVVQSAEGLTRRLVIDDVELGLEIAEHQYEPGGRSGPVRTHHQGHELGLVISGRLQVEVGRQTYELRPGDAIRFPSRVPHRFLNVGRGLTRAIWVNVRPAGERRAHRLGD